MQPPAAPASAPAPVPPVSASALAPIPILPAAALALAAAPAPLLKVTSTSNADQQRDELEAIEAIYADADLRIIRPAPADTTQPSASFSLLLHWDADADISAAAAAAAAASAVAVSAAAAPAAWLGQLRLLLDFPPDYPEATEVEPEPEADRQNKDVAVTAHEHQDLGAEVDRRALPRVELEVGSLSMLAFPGSVRRALLRAVREVASSNYGSSSAFACIQAANDWLASDAWQIAIRSGASTSTGIGSSSGTSGSASNNGAGSGLGVGADAVGTNKNVTSSDTINTNTSISALSSSAIASLTLIADYNMVEGRGGVDELSDADSAAFEARESEFVRIATEEACLSAARAQARTQTQTAVGMGVGVGVETVATGAGVLEGKTDVEVGSDSDLAQSAASSTGSGQAQSAVSGTGSGQALSSASSSGVVWGSGSEQLAVPSSASARGVWTYTVGLVGKPSAGKSTFFNAATRAVLRSDDGRKMADVAPHPFTTIEPNIGPGWFAGPADCYRDRKGDRDTNRDGDGDGGGSEDRVGGGSGRVGDRGMCDSGDREKDRDGDRDRGGSRAAVHGRDINGHRLLPVVIKDVAGLVPGAYKGRGKGNRFLADLCDADVLVHVVDATGRADRDGNALANGETGSSPGEDAQWIREELHRWIYGNIRAKWQSVCRLTRINKDKNAIVARVVALFSGYQGPRSCLERAAGPLRANLDLEHAPEWLTLDLHRLVAHYLAIRFPVCLALNKVDAFEEYETDGVARGVNGNSSNSSGSACSSASAGANSSSSSSSGVNASDSSSHGDANVNSGNNNGKDGKHVVRLCQRQARDRGEAAVPVSAFAEGWELLKMAHGIHDARADSTAGSLAGGLVSADGVAGGGAAVAVGLVGGNLSGLSLSDATTPDAKSKLGAKIGDKTKASAAGKGDQTDAKSSAVTGSSMGAGVGAGVGVGIGVSVGVGVGGGDSSTVTMSIRALLPPRGSPRWLQSEAALRRVMTTWGSTGVLEAVSAAVALRPPVFCYPVSDLDTEAPVGWTSSMGASVAASVAASMAASVPTAPRLRDCLLLKPGSTVGDVFDALKRGALSHVIVHGDFVRAEGKGLGLDPGHGHGGQGGHGLGVECDGKKRQVGRDTIVDDSCCVLRIQTNRKAVWQHQQAHQSNATAAVIAATSCL